MFEVLDSILINKDSKTSPIADYIWLIAVEDTINTETARGSAVEKIGESVRVSNSTKMTRVWNEFVEQAIEVRSFIRNTEAFDGIRTKPKELSFSNRFWI